jgi:tetratricopeptide (TPR) repeat protein
MGFSLRRTLRKAKKLAQQGDKAEAIGLYQSVLEQFPGNGSALRALDLLGKSSINPAKGASPLQPSPQQIQALITIYKRGQPQVVLEQGKALVAEFPNTPAVYNILGVVNAELGQLEEAIASWVDVIHLMPDHVAAHNNMGAALNDLGRSEEAVASCRKAIQFKPSYAEAHFNLGNALNALSLQEEAIASYTKATELKPDYAEAHSNLGAVLNELGRVEEAIASGTKAIQYRPDFAEGYSNLGAFFRSLDRNDEAINSYTKAIQFKPDYADVHNKLGVTLNVLGRCEEAIASCNRAIQYKPDFAEAYRNLGEILRNIGRTEEAMVKQMKAIELEPDHADAHNNLGATFSDLNRLEEAIASYAKATEIKIDFFEAHNNLGIALSQLGRNEEAAISYLRAIELKPDFAEGYRSLSTIKRFEITTDQQIERMNGLLVSNTCPDKARMQLSFALGKAYADLAEYGTAFMHLSEGNRLRKVELNYDRKAVVALFSQTKAWFSGDPASIDISQSSLKQTPIFIVGMPRSGTTLVEQILASHSSVHGAGELMLLGNSIHPAGSIMRSLNKRWLETTRDTYSSGLAKLNTAEPFITDKMTSNFLYLGFILFALPEAKIIHLKRDARATCWSIFKHYFSAEGNTYAYSLEDIAHFYKMYTDLMDFWHERFPNRIYDLNYEELTRNQEQETRDLLSYVGLDWDSNCLSFQDLKRPVATASMLQVRKKMYTGSSEEWRKYEQYLKPMLDALVEF